MKSENIFLIGPMGAGKSTVGYLLAQQLQWPFYDLDKVIEQRYQQTIPEIFSQHGEDIFRQYEMQMLAEITQQTSLILATGGGAITKAENRALLAERGTVIYLQTSVTTQWQRVQGSDRPLLQVVHPQQQLQNLFSQRESLYKTIADYTVETDQQIPEIICREIFRLSIGRKKFP